MAVDSQRRLYTFAVVDRTVEFQGQPLCGSRLSDERLQTIADLTKQVAAGKAALKRLARARDVLHPNSSELVDWPNPDASGNQATGRQALISLRDIDLLALVDLDATAALVSRRGRPTFRGDRLDLPRGSALRVFFPRRGAVQGHAAGWFDLLEQSRRNEVAGVGFEPTTFGL